MIETDICIIGAGPAGIMAAIWAAAKTRKVIVLESNTTAGRKLLLTGGGRCNLTHTGTIDEFLRAYKPFDRFVRHCIHEFSPDKTRNFFTSRGLATIAEPSGCIFPETGRSSDVTQILIDQMQKLNIKILYGKKVNSIKKHEDLFIVSSDKAEISSHSVIIATGGASWPKTGSTGDGYAFAKSFGHNIIEPKPCLVPLVTREKFCSAMAGTGIKNVIISCKIDGPLRRGSATTVSSSEQGKTHVPAIAGTSRTAASKKISSSGAMIFTHNGIGGPAVFDLSRTMAGAINNLTISVDLLADINAEELDRRFCSYFTQNAACSVISILAKFLPRALASQIATQENLAGTGASQISKKSRRNLVAKLKDFPFFIISPESIERATVTRGGADTAQIDPKTMQSRLCRGLFFAGEVINVDGPCGGYNLQFAFSSGALAGKSAVELFGKIT